MMKEVKLLIMLVSLILVSIFIVLKSTIYYDSLLGDNAKLNKLQNKIDSLQSENYSKDLIIGRYEVTMEIIKNDYPSCYDKIDTIFNTQTE